MKSPHVDRRCARLSSSLSLKKAFAAPVLVTAMLVAPAFAQATPDVATEPVTVDEGPIRVIEDSPYLFTDVVEVDLVNVEVWVTDRNGNPIEGLTAEDFRVFEDGDAMEISHFSEYSGMLTSPREETVPVLETATLADLENPAVVQPRLVVYFDNVHLEDSKRQHLIDDLRHEVRDGTFDSKRIAIVSQNPQIEVEAPFGSSPTELAAALAALERRPTLGQRVARDQDLMLLRLQDRWEQVQGLPERLAIDPCEDIATFGIREIDRQAAQTARRVSNTVGHLSGLASSLAGVPGTKVVLYVGQGLETRPGEEIVEFMADLCPGYERDLRLRSKQHNLLKEFEQLSRHANANRITVYTLDVGGLTSFSSASVEISTSDFRPGPAFDELRRANLRDSMTFLAEETGGRATFDRNRFGEVFDDLAQDLDHYYSLAYEPPHSGDDRTHVIDVEMKKRGYQIRHRLSYRDKPSDERMADRLQSALLLGIGENPLDIEVAHQEIQASGRNFEVPLTVTIPIDRLVLLDEDGQRLGRVRLQLAARDGQGRTTVFHQKHFVVEVDPTLEETAHRHTFVVDLEMRGGEHVVAVGLRDEIGRETSYLASKVDVQRTTF